MASNFKVISQTQTTEINPAGTGFHEVWNIVYQVTDGPAKGTQATVTVPEDDHNADYVASAIEAKIAALSDIASLGDG